MIVADLLGVLLRRWYVVLLGAAVSLLAVYVSTQQAGVYWTRFEVVLLPPIERVTNPNSLERGPYDLTSLAGTVVTQYNAGRHPQQMSTADTTLYGEGVRAGSAVRLHNSGSQWMQIHDRPVINVQVVGPDTGEVQRESRRILDRLAVILHERQEEIGVAEPARATVISSPTEPTVEWIGGSRSRAALATGLLGALITVVAAVWLDRRLARRSGRKVLSHHDLPPSPR